LIIVTYLAAVVASFTMLYSLMTSLALGKYRRAGWKYVISQS